MASIDSQIDSPCIKVCTLHPRVPVCTGCGRNLAEIERWSALSPEQRTELMAVVRKRLDDLQVNGWRVN
jgi:predicted Fe-S protein YdhL (DUF1289 family)